MEFLYELIIREINERIDNSTGYILNLTSNLFNPNF